MYYQPKKSFRIDDILQPSIPAERRDAFWPSRPTPIYLGPQHASTPPVTTDYLRNVTELPLINYQPLLHIADPFRHSMYKGLTDPRCWSLLPNCTMSMLARHRGHTNKRKGGQVRFTMEQTMTLESRFGGHKYLSPEERRHLAGQLKLSDRQVKTWFQNRRAKWRRAHQSSTSNADDSQHQSQHATSSNMPLEDHMYDSPQESPISLTS